MVSIYEVFRVALSESGENAAIQAVMAMQKATVVEMTPRLAMAAAKTSLELSQNVATVQILADRNGLRIVQILAASRVVRSSPHRCTARPPMTQNFQRRAFMKSATSLAAVKIAFTPV